MCGCPPFSSAQVWPDYPDVIVNDSLDWDSQVEVKAPCGCFVKSVLPGRGSHTLGIGWDRSMARVKHSGTWPVLVCVPVTLHAVFSLQLGHNCYCL